MGGNRTCAIVYTAVVFLAGMIGGALLMNLGEHFWLHPSGHVVTQGSWEKSGRQQYIEQFKRELNLNDAQSAQLVTILDETMRQYDDLHSFSHHIRDDGLTRIRAMLNPDQQKRFDEITKRMKSSEQNPLAKKKAAK
jgi:Spy/CpxP family protein refolding chaperone